MAILCEGLFFAHDKYERPTMAKRIEKAEDSEFAVDIYVLCEGHTSSPLAFTPAHCHFFDSESDTEDRTEIKDNVMPDKDSHRQGEGEKEPSNITTNERDQGSIDQSAAPEPISDELREAQVNDSHLEHSNVSQLARDRARQYSQAATATGALVGGLAGAGVGFLGTPLLSVRAPCGDASNTGAKAALGVGGAFVFGAIGRTVGSWYEGKINNQVPSGLHVVLLFLSHCSVGQRAR